MVPIRWAELCTNSKLVLTVYRLALVCTVVKARWYKLGLGFVSGRWSEGLRRGIVCLRPFVTTG